MKPSTTVRASRSSLPIRARIFGSTNLAPASGVGIWLTYHTETTEITEKCWLCVLCALCVDRFSHSRFRLRHDLEQFVDDLVRRNPFRFRAKIGEHPVAQHRMRERADVIEAHVVAPARQ